jgi:carboxypeptidase PM20D1
MPQRFVMMYAISALLIISALVFVLVVRAMRFGVPPEVFPPSRPPPIDAEEAARRLGMALRCPTLSWSDPGQFDREAFADLHRTLEEAFPRVHGQLKREHVGELSLLYTWTGLEPDLRPILLMAHQDVVPIAPGTAGDWTYPPFAGEVADGFIWGRGALDVKSALTGILEAAEALLQDGFQPRRTIYFAFGHDEEVGGYAGNALIAALLRERGVRLEYVLDEGGQIIRGVIPGLRVPVALLGIAEKGFANLTLTARGQGGHAAMPPRQTAAGILSRALLRLEATPLPLRLDFTLGMFDHLGRHLSFWRRLVFANLWLFRPLVVRMLAKEPKMNAGLRTTLAPTMLRGGIKENVLPAEVSAVMNTRILPGDTLAGTLERVRRIIDDARVDIIPAAGIEPSPVSPIESSGFALLRRTILETAGEVAVAPFLVVGATDSRYYAGLTDQVFRFLFNRMEPSDLKRIHGTDERISVDNYVQAVGFYHRLIVNSEEI